MDAAQTAERLEAALGFARDQLGEASVAHLRTPEAQALLLTRLRQQPSIEDATLAVVFRAARTDRRLADEFFAHLFGDLSVSGRSLVTPALRELMETGELVDSVVRDMWRDLESVEFRTRGQFLAYLLQRMQWKRNNRIRSAKRIKRGGDAEPVDGADFQDLPDRQRPSPLSEAERVDDLRRLAKLSAGLDPAEREMLFLRTIQGYSYTEIGERFDLSPNTVKARIEELVSRMREHF
jgi:RNA polymerase sigma factor (sigma-70 family)